MATLLAALILVMGSAPSPTVATDPPVTFDPPAVADPPRLQDPSSHVVTAADPPAPEAFTAPGFQETVVLSGLTSPMVVEFAANGHVFVAEKSGIIKEYDSLTDPTPTTWADIRANVHDYWDRGLMGMTLDPNFTTNGRAYVAYAHNSATPPWPDGSCPSPPGGQTDGCVIDGRLSVLTGSGGGLATESVLVTSWCQQFPSHSMSDVLIGDDGALYVNGGDGANFNVADYGQFGGSSGSPTPKNPCGDPPTGVGGTQTLPTAEGGALRSQDVRGTATADPVGLNGTVIRVSPTTGLAMPDNPAIGASDLNERRIIAYGLRNPFRMALHPDNGQLWIGDVGWSSFEEINRHSDPNGAVRNFGWPCREGGGAPPANLSVYNQADLCISITGLTLPHFAYGRGSAVVSGDGCPTGGSISGMAFYDGGPYPALYDDALFFTDYSRDCLWVMPDTNHDGVPDAAARAHFASVSNPVHLTTGPNGDLFYVDHLGGAVRRITFIGSNGPPMADIEASDTSVMIGAEVDFDASGSTDPEDDPLTYAWDFGDDDGLFDDATGVAPSHTYTGPGSFLARVRVRDGFGGEDIAEVTINVDNNPPTATITQPAASLTWSVDQVIGFAGTGTDPEQGALPPSAMTWQLIMHHCNAEDCHEHPIGTFDNVDDGQFPAPDHEYPAHLELRLTVEDQHGATDVASVTLQPKTVNLRIESTAPGTTLTAGWVTAKAPFTLTAIRGSAIQLNASTPQTVNGLAWYWQSWTDGGAQTHSIEANASATYRANFAGGFTDVATSAFRNDIAWLVANGITAGCGSGRFCPNAPVTREQMASFLVRSLGLVAGSTPDRFTDIATSAHRSDINRLATAGLTRGCTTTRFCPGATVTREQMASFLARALELAGAAPDAFSDDDASMHETDINRIAREGVTAGCAPDRFCPTAVVTRGQMAAFLHRAFEDRFP